MNLIEEDIVAFAKSRSSVTAALGAPPTPLRLYPNRAPEGAPEPYTVYTKVSSVRETAQEGNIGFARSRFQFSTWAADYKAAKLATFALVQAFHGYAGPMGTRDRVVAIVEDEHDLWDQETREAHVALDVFLWHAEDVPTGP